MGSVGGEPAVWKVLGGCLLGPGGDAIEQGGKAKPQDSNSGVAQGYAYETGLWCLRKYRGFQLLWLLAGTSD